MRDQNKRVFRAKTAGRELLLWIELTFYLTLDLHVVQVTLEELLYRHVVRGVPDQDPPLG